MTDWKAAKIRELLAEGWPVGDIAETLGCHRTVVKKLRDGIPVQTAPPPSLPRCRPEVKPQVIPIQSIARYIPTPEAIAVACLRIRKARGYPPAIDQED